MQIYTVWATRKYASDEPELLTAWDEYSVDGNPEGFEEDVKKSIDSLGTDYLAHRVVVITIDSTLIDAAFLPVKVEGTVE